jgi:hypothetical protein
LLNQTRLKMQNTSPTRPPRREIDPPFIARHGLQGMVPGSAGGANGDAAQVDRPIAEEPCPVCETPREYRPFIHGTYGSQRCFGGSYRAFSVCPGCGLEEEF